MKKFTLALFAASMIFLSGCGQKVEIDTSPTVIKINNHKITKKMVDDSFKKGALASNNIDVNKPQNKFIYLIYKNKVVNDLIIKDLLTQEAKKRNVSVSDKDLNAKIDEVINKVGGKARFEATLALNKLDKDSFKDIIKDDLLKQKLVENISGTGAVNDNQVKDFYVKNQAKYFNHPDMVRASHILISVSEAEIKAKLQNESGKKMPAAQIDKEVKSEISAAKTKAEKILAKVKAEPAKFAELAQKTSQDPASAQKGGDLGFFSEKEMVSAFSKTAFSMKPGEISKNIVKTEFGYHIIKVIDRKKAGVTPFEEVKEQIKKYIAEQNKMETLQKLVESSKSSAKIVYLDKEYNPENIQNEIKEFMKNKKPNEKMSGMPMTRPGKEKVKK